MVRPSVFIYGFHDRVNEEIKKQNITKAELAKHCRFNRKNFYSGNLTLAYFARLCAELHVSADYLLFGKGK